MATSISSPVLDASTTETLVRFHLSLNVGDLSQAQAFYRVLFDMEPAKLREDYAKFELVEPPLVLSLIPGAHSGGGALNHVGMRLVSAERLVETQARLEMAGYRTQREEGVVCCYARQTKFWVTDPDRTLWELYILHDDDDRADHAGYHQATVASQGDGASRAPTTLMSRGPKTISCAPAAMNSAPAMTNGSATKTNAPAAANSAAAPTTWLHNLTQPLPERLELADDSVDEVFLQGTFNAPHEPARLAAFLAEVFRALRPGGQVTAHGLVADRPLVNPPSLPGPAALVSHVPLEGWPAATLTGAGFVSARFAKLEASPCFGFEGAELRESKVVGQKPAAGDSAPAAAVIYRGPFRAVTDDEGHRFERGERVQVCGRTLALLKSGPLAEQFTILDGKPASDGCGA